jgi:hypothetical protein
MNSFSSRNLTQAWIEFSFGFSASGVISSANEADKSVQDV